MKKYIAILALAGLLSEHAYADRIHHLQCKYNDGSGNIKIIVNKDKKTIRRLDDMNDDEYTNLSWNQNVGLAYLKTSKPSTGKFREDYLGLGRGKKDLRVYKVIAKTIYVDLSDINNNFSNRAEVNINSSEFVLYVDDKNRETIFMPSEKEMNLSSRGKELHYEVYPAQIGSNFRLNCFKN